MSLIDWIPSIVFFTLLVVLTPPLGLFLSHLFSGSTTFLTPYLGWLEKLTYRIAGIDPTEEMRWQQYAKNLVIFNGVGFVFLFFFLLLQALLPLNPQHFESISWPLAFNIAISFTTNTNWQSYAGETTLSYATQMLGLTVQNFLSAATGCTILMAMIRGLIRKNSATIGNFWCDLVRIVIYLFLPLSILLATTLVSQGVIQTFAPYPSVHTLEGAEQTIPLGPVASQIAIKQLGSNGGGFFHTNSAHPFENPTPLSNLLENLAILLIPASTVYAYGLLIRSKKHAYMLLSVMVFIWIINISVAAYSEYLHNPITGAYPLLEGKETRFGISNSLLWAVSTTATSNGSVNVMLDSLSPLAGGIALFNLMLGESIFGGIGVGLASMLMFALLTVFLSGLMVGRTPEYLGKKIERQEVQWIILAVLTPSLLILIGSSIACMIPDALASISNPGPHGLTQLLYAFSSAAANNGSAFAGFNANTVFYNLVLGVIMGIARLAILIPSLGIAGSLASKNITPPSLGTLPTTTGLFAGLLVCIIIIMCTLTFLPVLSLGPIVEQLLMLKGYSFPLPAVAMEGA